MFVPKFPRRTLLIVLAAALGLAACGAGATPAPTVDVNAINTAAVATAMGLISAQFTQTALAAPTITPLPTDTPPAQVTFAAPTAGASPTGGAQGILPTVSFNTTPIAGFTPLATSIVATSGGVGNTASGCNDAAFVGETLPDGSVVGAGKKFNKAWELKNTGTCNWDEGYAFTFRADLSSSAISGYDIVIKASNEITKPNHSQSFIIKLTAPDKAGEYKGYWQLKADNGSFFGPIVYFVIVVK